MSLKNIFCSFCKIMIHKNGPSYKSDRFMSAANNFFKRISAFNVNLCCFSTNCIVGIKPLKILLTVHPHSTAFKNVISLNFLIIHKHTNVE